MKRHRNDGKGERKACVDGEVESGESGRATFVDSSSQPEGALARAVNSTLDEYDWYSGPVHQYCVTANASRKPNLNDYERDDTMPLVSHTAVGVF